MYMYNKSVCVYVRVCIRKSVCVYVRVCIRINANIYTYIHILYILTFVIIVNMCY